MNTDHPTQGPCFTRTDLDTLVEDGHEIGCHTFAHVAARRTPLAVFEAEIVRNRKEMERVLPGYPLENFAYPGGEVTFRAKQRMGRFSDSSRSIYEGINRGAVDLDLLLVQYLRVNIPLERVKNCVESCTSQPAWLIYYVHDVCDNHSRGGCTPEYMKSVLKLLRGKIPIFTVRDALKLERVLDFGL